MITHKTSVRLDKSEFKRINKLLAIEALDEMTDRELLDNGANTNVCEGIFEVEFDNGASMTFDLCSGNHNYWDDVVWRSHDGNTDVVLDCAYELGDIEVEINKELYIVNIVKD